jgi:two-component system, NarL family, sensor kinase
MTPGAGTVTARRRAGEAALGGTVAAVLVLLALAGLLTSDGADTPSSVATLTLAAGFLPLGLFVLGARPGHLVGRVVLAIGLVALAAVAAAGWAHHVVAAWATQWLWWPPLALIPLALLAFPGGHLPTGSRRWVAWLLVLTTAVSTTTLATAALSAPRTLLTSAQAAPVAARPWVVATVAGAVVVILLTVLVVIDMVARARADDAEGSVRSQILCLLPAGVLLVAGTALDAGGMSYSLVPAALALPLGMGLAILRYGVDDLDLVVNRTLVWLVMSGAVLVAFALTIALTSSTVLGERPLLASAIGTGIIAAGFDPLRRVVQRALDRLLFGDRDRPHQVVSNLGRRMHQASDPGGMLTEFVATLTDALRVPYARILVTTRGAEPLVVAESGRPQPGTHAFPLVAHGDPVGTLEVAPRRSGGAFTPAEEALLTQVSTQAAIAAQAHRLTLDLQRARTVLVRAREEERLRLRHDLHDGLGPALAGTRMQLTAARGRLASGPAPGDPAVGVLLASALEVLADCTAEVRRVVDGLRPPALDRGLGAALAQRVDVLLPDHHTSVQVPTDLPDLPPAVEVAAYRIATEAMTNVVRHAHARSCHVDVRAQDDWLDVTVTDDGVGGVRPRDGGVGLESMANRAEELGGTCRVLDADPGTRVEVRIPLAPS